MTDLVVAEVFGPTFQGEGPSAGQRAMFIRLGRCNLDCRWCDTPYTWDWKGQNGTVYDPAQELSAMSLRDVRDLVDLRCGGQPLPDLFVITGGEPMLQRGGLLALCAGLHHAGASVEVETNGTHVPTAQLAAHARFNVSPKLANSGVDPAKALVPDALWAFSSLAQAGRACFKFVVTHVADLDEVAKLVDGYSIPDDAVWIMPEGRDATTLGARAVQLADSVLEAGWNLSGRMHVELWGDARGH